MSSVFSQRFRSSIPRVEGDERSTDTSALFFYFLPFVSFRTVAIHLLVIIGERRRACDRATMEMHILPFVVPLVPYAALRATPCLKKYAIVFFQIYRSFPDLYLRFLIFNIQPSLSNFWIQVDTVWLLIEDLILMDLLSRSLLYLVSSRVFIFIYLLNNCVSQRINRECIDINL